MYAATRKANELMANTSSPLFRTPMTGLFLIEVYGAWGPKILEPTLFTKAVFPGEPIRIFNHGRMRRDFIYIDDIVDGVIRVLDMPAAPDSAFDPAVPDPSRSSAPYRILNIGNDEQIELLRFIDVLEAELGVPAIRQLEDIQPGGVPATWADVDAQREAVGFAPTTPVEDGVRRFVAQYREFYRR